MSGLNIQDTTNTVKAAAQQTAPVAGEESQMASQTPNPTQELDTEGSQQAPPSQAPGPMPKPPKAAKQQAKASKPTTRAAAKNSATAPRVEAAEEDPQREQLRDPEIAEILPPACEPKTTGGNSATNQDAERSEAEMNREARTILMAKIVKAENDGDDAKVERYMKMYKAVLADQKSKGQKTGLIHAGPIISIPPAIPQKRPTPDGETTQVRNVKFIAGRSNSHDDGGFPPYFHKLLLECKGPLPL
ncbi:hypothetical protein PTTG_09641, partial [Puccinia triticina 1-1 BBBD Race 1]